MDKTTIAEALAGYFVAGGASDHPLDQDRGPELGGGPWDRNDPDRPSAQLRDDG